MTVEGTVPAQWYLDMKAERDALREALGDQAAMADQSVETLRDLHANWRRIVDEQDPDGGPLIENILYWLIEDVTPTEARAALARLSSENTPDEATP